jgi:hypothetical protein
MAGTTPTRPDEHDRVHLLASSPKAAGREKEPEPAATANIARYEAGDPASAQPASTSDMPVLP